MFNYTTNALEMSIDCFKEYDNVKVEKVSELEDRIDVLEKDLRMSHIRRLNSGKCDAVVGAVFLDLISNLERVGDHSMNIAGMIAS